MQDVQFALPVLLSDIPNAQDACVDRLTVRLENHDGVHQAHVVSPDDDNADCICVHYDAGVVSLSRIRQTAKSLGSRITNRFGHLDWPVDESTSPRQARRIAERLRRSNGVKEAETSTAKTIRVEYDREATNQDEVLDFLESTAAEIRDDAAPTTDDTLPSSLYGRDPNGQVDEASLPKEIDPETDSVEHSDAEHSHAGHSHGGLFGEQTELIVSLVAGVVLGVGFALSFAAAVPQDVSFVLYLTSYGLGGWFTVLHAYENLRAGRFEVDTLMIVAAAGAAALGKWVEGAFLLFLFSTGHALEHYAMDRARSAIESLADLAPETARVRRNGTEQQISVEELRCGDVAIVRPNERLPADGIVKAGKSDVNQAPVTGESMPVSKTSCDSLDDLDCQDEELEATVRAEHRVYAGTINGTGALEVLVTRTSEESTLARVVEMVTEAEAEQSPSQKFTNRFERYFVPSVLGLVGLLLFAWIPLDETFAESFYRAMAVLVAASPCALAIATSSAVLSGVARAGQNGVLIKGGGPLERLGNLTSLAFDKTGTLTEGSPKVTDVLPHDGTSEETLLQTIVSVERLSDHPLAEAIVEYGQEHLNGVDTPKPSQFDSLTGRGVRAVVNGSVVHIGNADLFGLIGGDDLPEDLRRTVDDLESQGRTTIIVRRGNRYLGILGLMDTPREDAADVIKQLRRTGIRRMVMISGDNQQVTESLGSDLNLDEAHGDLLPDDKVERIQSLRRNGEVAMVGDGVNDAPAMANATVGIAMGAAGSDVALETADVALMADRLAPLPFALGLSRKTSRTIKQNLWIALGMVVILVPATIFGLNIGPAVVLHEGSTLLVVGNALRLLNYSE